MNCIQLPTVSDIIKRRNKQPAKIDKTFKENLKDKKLEKKYFYMRNFCDIYGHPGLLTANIGQHIALITLMESDINVELLQDNRPILDVVGTSHTFRDEGGASSQTSMLAVAEDGALRGWTLNTTKEVETGVWKSVFDFNNSEQIMNMYITSTTNELEYPVDFFECCESINEVEYTSPQLQRIYNKQQIRQRLAPGNTNNSSYIAWRGSFTINVRSTRLIRGFRIHLGANGQDAVPPAVTLNGKRQFYFVDINRPKWVDVPFTPDETLEFNGKIALQFAASNHQDHRVIIDAIKVFGQSREKVMTEKKNCDRRKIGQDITCLGPRDKFDVTRSMAVEAFAASSNLITKATTRADMLDRVWTYLDHQHALISSIRTCSRFLPEHINFNRKRDIIAASQIVPINLYDWKTFQQMAARIYDIAKKRPENFRTYFTSQMVLDAFDHLVSEFSRLISDDEEAGVRSIIFPSCHDLRKLTNQIVYVLALCALMDPTRIIGLVRFVTSPKLEISFGARDAILEAMLMESNNSKNGAVRLASDDAVSLSDNDENDDVSITQNSEDEEQPLAEQDEENDEVDDDDDDDDDEDDDDDGNDDDDDDDEFDEDGQGIFENGNEDAVVVQLDDINSLQDLLEMSNGPLDGGLRQMMDEGGLMDFAFALSLRDREQNRRAQRAENADQPVSADVPAIESSGLSGPTDPAQLTKSVDAIFSTERERQFAMNIIELLLSEPTAMTSIAIKQLIVTAVASLNPDDVDEVEIIDLALQNLINEAKASPPQLLAILAIDEIINSNKKIGAHIVTTMIDGQLPTAFYEYVATNLPPFYNYVEPENQEGELITVATNLLKSDYHPFSEIGVDLFSTESHYLVIAILGLLENAREIDSSLVISSKFLDDIFKLIVCDSLPPGLQKRARKFAMTFTASVEKYKSRRDQQRLAKYIGQIKQIIDTIDSDEIKYNVITEIYEEVRSISQIAEKRNFSWQKFCENDISIVVLLLSLCVKIECCSKEIIRLFELAITSSIEKVRFYHFHRTKISIRF